MVAVDIRRGNRRQAQFEAAAAQIQDPPPVADPTPSTWTIRHALVAHHSHPMRQQVRRVLEDQGYQVADAGNGEEALHHLAELTTSSPGVLALVDSDLPQVDGPEFIRRVRANPNYHAVRIVMMTMAPEIERLTHVLEEGAAEFLVKPFSTHSLLERIRATPD